MKLIVAAIVTTATAIALLACATAGAETDLH